MATKRSVQSIAPYAKLIHQFQNFRVSIPLPSLEKLSQIGFPSDSKAGDSILPIPTGKVSDFNANGKTLIRKDLAKVSQSGMSWRQWTDWHGNTHSGPQFRTYKVYPRELITPPSEYVEILSSAAGVFLCSRALNLAKDGEVLVLHVINLFLDLFGELNIVDEKLESATPVQVKRLNWKVLPPGKYPFARAMQELTGYISDLGPDVKEVVETRIKTITQYNPDFLAVGVGGFKDYVVFGFSATGKYVLESPSLGNATYVFKNDWQDLSHLTKRQILEGALHEARVIHNRKWNASIRNEIQSSGR
jgi:hypothetical protein